MAMIVFHEDTDHEPIEGAIPEPPSGEDIALMLVMAFAFVFLFFLSGCSGSADPASFVLRDAQALDGDTIRTGNSAASATETATKILATSC